MNTHPYCTRLSAANSACGLFVGQSCLFENADHCTQPAAYPANTEARWQRSYEQLSYADTLLLDTCVLVDARSASFLPEHAPQLRERHIKFTILPQLMMELAKMSAEPETSQRATAALHFITNPAHADLFRFEQGEGYHTHLDRIILRKIAREYRTSNILVLTNDTDLIADIYGMTATASRPRDYVTHALSFNEYGLLIRRRAKRLNLSPLVELPPCELVGAFGEEGTQPLCRPALLQLSFIPPLRSATAYRHDAIAQGICYVSREGLESLLTPGGQLFLHELVCMKARGQELSLSISEPSLTPALREQLAPWLPLFTIRPAVHPDMNEEDALLCALYHEPIREGDKGKRHLTLLCGSSLELYSHLLSRSPRSFKTWALWGVSLTDDGSLLRAAAPCSYSPALTSSLVA